MTVMMMVDGVQRSEHEGNPSTKAGAPGSYVFSLITKSSSRS